MWVEKGNLKRLHTVWFHLYNFLKNDKNHRNEQISGWQRLGREVGVCGYERPIECFFVMMEMFWILTDTNVDIPIVRLH